MLGMLAEEGRGADRSAPADEARRAPSMPQKRQGDRFAQAPLFADSRLAPSPAESRDLERALPAGRNFH
jgi:hypothetical protein